MASETSEHQRILNLVGELLGDAGRDVHACDRREGPNWRGAGHASLVTLDAVISYLTGIRNDVLYELILDTPAEQPVAAVDPGDIIEITSGPGWTRPTIPHEVNDR